MNEILKYPKDQTYYSPTTKYKYNNKNEFINDIYSQPINTILITTKDIVNIFITELFFALKN